jgi:hypothetical protein
MPSFDLPGAETLVDGEFYEYRRPDFYMALTAEGRAIARAAGWRAVVAEVESSLVIARTQPFGSHSIHGIDYLPPTEIAHTAHRLTRTAEALLGIPVAVKGRNPYYTDSWGCWFARLEDQFHHMHKLATAQRLLHPEGIDGRVFFNRPLGYIVCAQGPQTQEWLLMDRVVDGKCLEPELAYNIYGEVRWGFIAGDHPYLAALTKNGVCSIGPDECIPFEDLVSPLQKALGGRANGRELGDIHARNILEWHLPDGAQAYTIIDMQPL